MPFKMHICKVRTVELWWVLYLYMNESIIIQAMDLVLDIGSGISKFGISGECNNFDTPTVVGNSKNERFVFPLCGLRYRHAFVGWPLENMRPVLTLKYPVQRGIIVDWTAMEHLWDYIFYDELRVGPENHNVMMTEIPSNPSKNRERTTEQMFENYNVPGMSLENEAALSLYATGKKSGVVLSSGEGVTYCVAIEDSVIIKHATQLLNLGGSDVTEHLQKSILYNHDIRISPYNADVCKQSTSYISSNTTDNSNGKDKCNSSGIKQQDQVKTKQHFLPDGTIINLTHECYECAEIMFKPWLTGDTNLTTGIHNLVYNTIQKCPIEKRKTMYSNIICAGGNTMLLNFQSRLTQEIQQLMPIGAHSALRILAPADRKSSACLGGSIITSLSSYPWIRKSEYDEFGPNIIHKARNPTS